MKLNNEESQDDQAVSNETPEVVEEVFTKDITPPETFDTDNFHNFAMPDENPAIVKLEENKEEKK